MCAGGAQAPAFSWTPGHTIVVACGLVPFFFLMALSLMLLARHGVIVTPGSAGAVLAYLSLLALGDRVVGAVLEARGVR